MKPSSNYASGMARRGKGMITTIPEACLAYTQIFTTLKLEIVISMVIGLVIGYLARRLEE